MQRSKKLTDRHKGISWAVYFIVFFTATSLFSGSSIFNPFKSNINGLLNPKNLSMQNQFLFSYSSMQQGITGLYMNTMSYKLKAPLILQAHLGAGYNNFDSKENGTPLSGFTLFYNPSKDLNFAVDYGNHNTALLDLNRKALSFILNKTFFNDSLSVSVYYSEVK